MAAADDATRQMEANRREEENRTAQLEVARRRRRGDHFKFHGFHGPQVLNPVLSLQLNTINRALLNSAVAGWAC